METPEQYQGDKKDKHGIDEAILFENHISELMFAIASKLSKKIVSFQAMRDDDFVHRKDRTINDIHIFLGLKNGQYFHLRAYTRHMLDMDEIPKEEIFLTGYIKSSISHTGGEHSFRQGWYKWDAECIAREILEQNSSLFF